MPDSSTPLGHALQRSPAGAALIERLAAGRRIAAALAEDPTFMSSGVNANRPGFIDVREQQLRLNARSAAEAAKLRQMLPHLQKALLRCGFEGSEIRVSLQPRQTAYPSQPDSGNIAVRKPEDTLSTPIRTARTLEFVAFLRQLAGTMTNSRLKNTVDTLLQRYEGTAPPTNPGDSGKVRPIRGSRS